MMDYLIMSRLLFGSNLVTQCHNSLCSTPSLYVSTKLVSLLIRLNWVESYYFNQLVLSGDLSKFSLITKLLLPANYLYYSVLTFVSTWKMVKDAPYSIPMNMIGSAKTSHNILNDGDILILLVVLIIPKALRPSV